MTVVPTRATRPKHTLARPADSSNQRLYMFSITSPFGALSTLFDHFFQNARLGIRKYRQKEEPC